MDATEPSGATRKSWRADEGLELAKARLHGIRADGETIEHEFSEAQCDFYRAKAQFTALLGSVYMDSIEGGADLSDVANRALISVSEIWLLLSGTYEPSEMDWIQRVSAGFFAACQERSVGRLRSSLEEFKRTVFRFENVHKRREDLRQRISDAEEDLKRITADLAALAVEGERRREKLISGEAGQISVTIPDAQGYACKPNPLSVESQVDFLNLLRRYREWAGNPSYRTMADRVAGGPSHATLANIIRLQVVPKKLKTLEAFVRGLGGGDEDVRIWVTAWRRLTSSTSDLTAGNGDD